MVLGVGLLPLMASAGAAPLPGLVPGPPGALFTCRPSATNEVITTPNPIAIKLNFFMVNAFPHINLKLVFDHYPVMERNYAEKLAPNVR
jgi:hypothetical protein